MRKAQKPIVALITFVLTAWLAGENRAGRSPRPAPSQAVGHMALVDIALKAGVQDRLRSERGVAAADFNNDGYLDFFLSNFGEANVLFYNNGDGTFTPDYSLPNAQIHNMSLVASAADYNNDGYVDIFVGNGGFGTPPEKSRLYRNDGIDPKTGRATFTDVSDFSGIGGPLTATMGGVWGDYDNDGFVDLYISNRGFVPGVPFPMRNILFRNRGDGTFEDVTAKAGVGGNWTLSSYGFHSASWADFDNDGWLDLYVPNYGGDNLLYHNNHDGTFTNIADSLISSKPYGAFASAVGDFNNDGWLDLAVTEYSRATLATRQVPDAQAVRLFLNRGQGRFEDVTFAVGLTNSTSTPMGFQIGEFNNDGYLDILLGNWGPPGGQKSDLYVSVFDPQSGQLHFEDQSNMIDYPAPEELSPKLPYPSYPYRGHGTFFGDVDNDGDLDLFMGNGGPFSVRPDTEPSPWCRTGAGCCGSFCVGPNVEPKRLYRNDGGNLKNWLSIKLVGTASNRDAIGARVKVTSSSGGSNTRNQYKVVQGGSGFNSNNPFDVHVGLWDDDTVQTIEVKWPRGLTQTFNNIRINQRIIITEGDRSPKYR